MARYRYMLTDLMTGRVLSDAVTLVVDSYGRALNAAGDCSAKMLLADPEVRRLTDPIHATEPRRTALWIIRDENPAWGGIIWTRRYSSGVPAFELGASSFESYFARRRLRASLSYRQVDQHAIMEALVRHAQAVDYGNIRIVVVPARPSGKRRDRDYYWHERATYWERMTQLAEVIDGPDFTITPQWGEGGVPVAVLQVGSPLGVQNRDFVAEFPGDVLSYTWPDDGGDSANFWTAIGEPPEGSAQNTPPPMRDASVAAEWRAGIPLLEDVSSHQGTFQAATLQGYASANVLASVGNRAVPEVSLHLPAGALLPRLGDTLTVRVTDPLRFPVQQDGAVGKVARVRLTGWSVALSSEADETLTVTLSEVQ